MTTPQTLAGVLRNEIARRQTNASKVALACGMSAGTVSRALRGLPILSTHLLALLAWVEAGQERRAYSSPTNEEPKPAQGDWRHLTTEAQVSMVANEAAMLSGLLKQRAPYWSGEPGQELVFFLRMALMSAKMLQKQRVAEREAYAWQVAVNADLRRQLEFDSGLHDFAEQAQPAADGAQGE